jgi:hypothetical protein
MCSVREMCWLCKIDLCLLLIRDLHPQRINIKSNEICEVDKMWHLNAKIKHTLPFQFYLTTDK